jgi:peptidoglycan/LPS O-acetylase OafA/YrhL
MLAVALVLGRHLEPSRPADPWPQQIVTSGVIGGEVSAWTIFPELLRRGGWVGVDLFFVLSGFLVAGLLFAEYRDRGRLSIGRFYLRRAWKILPPFLVLIAVTLAVDRPLGELSGRKSLDTRSLVAELAMLQNYLGGFWPHTWSLSVEEHFYLVLPVVAAGLLAWNRRSLGLAKPFIALAVIPITLAFTLRLNKWSDGTPFDFYTHHALTHFRFDALALGVAIAWYYHFHPVGFRERLAPRRHLLIVAGAMLLIPAFVWPQESPIIYLIGLTLFLTAGGLLTTGLVLCEFPKRGILAAIAGLGAYSYSIYLWHIPMRDWIIPAVDHLWGEKLNYAARSAIYVIGSLLLGVIMAKLIELPLLRLRDRWFPTSGPIAPSQRAQSVSDGRGRSLHQERVGG